MNFSALEMRFVELLVLGIPGIEKNASTCWMHKKNANVRKARTIVGVIISLSNVFNVSNGK